MSDYAALGGVSRSLRTLLQDRMEIPPLPSGFTRVPITIGTPDEDDDTSVPRINLFLYRVTENRFHKNQEIPGHGHPAAYGQPPLTLDLHYLVTAYGSTKESGAQFSDETLAQWLMGSAMRVLHDYPIITEDLENGEGVPILDTSLLGEFERVKLCLEPLSLEDVTKVWTALTLPFRLSAAYAVSVVQIESQGPRRYPKVVGELPDAGPRVKAITLNPPRIDQIRVRRQELPTTARPSVVPYARIGDRLVVLGTGFVKDETKVRIGPVDVDPEADPRITNERLDVTIPDDADLQPGAQPIRLYRQIQLGEPATDHTGLHSNLTVVMLVPRVASATLAAGNVTITGSRLFQENHPCQTILGDAIVKAETYSTASPTTIGFPLPTLPADTYAVRVRVNGAESIDDVTLTVT
jgi:hypothetical protein